MKSLKEPRYQDIVNKLKEIRESKGLTIPEVAKKMNINGVQLLRFEQLEETISIIELLDILQALECAPKKFFIEIGWIPSDEIDVPVPVKGAAIQIGNNIKISLTQGQNLYQLELDNIEIGRYIEVEEKLSILFNLLNKGEGKNRDAIASALIFAVNQLPNANPSDIYHHIVYRSYLRDYNKSKAEQSWVRAGGEAMELFIQKKYEAILAKNDIVMKPLVNSQDKISALQEMGISDKVGQSKLDIALYGTWNGRQVIFGGIHSKASLAERVSDDVPCSVAMMQNGFISILFTFDAKSYPPPGDLVNRGELGTLATPSDKRKYIEEHGSFDACFSYNLRTIGSGKITKSGKKIFVSKFDERDYLPEFIVAAWKRFKTKNNNPMNVE